MTLSIDVEPEGNLRFEGDFWNNGSTTKEYLTIHNLSADTPILFKLKASCKQRYDVHPHRGEVACNSTVKVVIELYSFQSHEDAEAALKDRFLLQACPASELNRQYTRHDFWDMVAKQEVYQRQFKCIFHPVLPEGSKNGDQCPQQHQSLHNRHGAKFKSISYSLQKHRAKDKPASEVAPLGVVAQPPQPEPLVPTTSSRYPLDHVTLALWMPLLLVGVSFLLGLVLGKVYL